MTQNSCAKAIAETESAMSSVPPTRKGLAPNRSTRKPTGVCSAAVVAPISATAAPSVAKETPNSARQARNSGGRQRM